MLWLFLPVLMPTKKNAALITVAASDATFVVAAAAVADLHLILYQVETFL